MRKRNIILGCAVAFFAVYRIQPYEPIVVVGHSMEPTFGHMQLVAATRNFKQVNRGDVVIFEHDGAQVLKRVVGLPGDKITKYYSIGEWVLPRLDVHRKFMIHKKCPSQTITVPPGMLYVLGDNPNASVDSRNFGPIPYSELRAKLLNADTSIGLPPGMKMAARFAVNIDKDRNSS